MAAIAAALSDQADERARAKVLGTLPSGWRNHPDHHQERGFRGAHGFHLVRYRIAGGYQVEGVDDLEVGECDPLAVELTVKGVSHRFEIARFDHIRSLLSSLGPIQLEVIPRFPVATVREPAGSIHAPMPGKVIRVGVEVGDEIGAGDMLVVLEAMKMEHTLRSPHEGIVTGIECRPGDQVEAGATLVVVGQSSERQPEVDSTMAST